MNSIKNVLGLKDVLTMDECSVYTGMAKSYLYKLTSKRAIPFYKPMGKMLFFKRTEIEAWLTQNLIATDAEIEQQAVNYCYSNKA